MPRKKTIGDKTVLEAAAKVMFAEGPEFTLAKVAAAAGIAPATLLQRFGDKHRLVVAAIAHDNALFAEQLASLDRTKGADAVIAVFRLLTPDDVAAERAGDGLLWLRQDMRDPDLNALARERFAMLRAAVMVRLPPLPLDPAEAAQSVEAQWQGALLQWGIAREGKLDAFVTRSLKNWFRLATGRRLRGVRRASRRRSRRATPA